MVSQNFMEMDHNYDNECDMHMHAHPGTLITTYYMSEALP